jgi:translation initiation factor IF-3
LIGKDDEQVGLVALEKAREMAKEAELDLVEIAPTAKPPVCKIMDYGKFLYSQKKHETKQRKQQKQTEVKGIRIGFRTGEHDLEIKRKKAEEFLGERNIVKVTMILRGREFAHMDLAYTKMKEFAALLKEISEIDLYPKRLGNTINMVLTPK